MDFYDYRLAPIKISVSKLAILGSAMGELTSPQEHNNPSTDPGGSFNTATCVTQ
jgi:hypothetical protein